MLRRQSRKFVLVPLVPRDGIPAEWRSGLTCCTLDYTTEAEVHLGSVNGDDRLHDAQHAAFKHRPRNWLKRSGSITHDGHDIGNVGNRLADRDPRFITTLLTRRCRLCGDQWWNERSACVRGGDARCAIDEEFAIASEIRRQRRFGIF